MTQYTVTGPDGKEYDIEVPEGKTIQEAVQKLKDNYPKIKAAQSPTRQANTNPSDEPKKENKPYFQRLKDRLTGKEPFFETNEEATKELNLSPELLEKLNKTKEGINYGLGDLPRGVNQLAANVGINPFVSAEEANKNAIAREQRFNESGASSSDRLLGNVAFPLPGIGGVGSLASRGLVRGALAGGTNALAQPVASDDYLGSKAEQVLTGLGLGAIGGKLVQVGSNAGREALQRLKDFGIDKFTLGQRLGGAFRKTEEKATSLPILGDIIKGTEKNQAEQFIRADANDALKPIGEKVSKNTKVGFDLINELHDKTDEAYEKILPNIKLKATPELENKLSTKLSDLNELEKGSQIKAIVENKVLKPLEKGEVDGKTANTMQSEIRKKIDSERRRQSPDYEYIDKLQGVRDALLDEIGNQNPKYEKALKDVRTAYAKVSKIDKAAARRGLSDGEYTPADRIQTARQGYSTRQKAAGNYFDQEILGDAYKELANKTPNSFSADRLNLNPIGIALGGAASIPYIGANALAQRPGLLKVGGNALQYLTPPITREIGNDQ